MKGSHVAEKKPEDFDDKVNLISSSIIHSPSREEIREVKKEEDKKEELASVEGKKMFYSEEKDKTERMKPAIFN